MRLRIAFLFSSPRCYAHSGLDKIISKSDAGTRAHSKNLREIDVSHGTRTELFLIRYHCCGRLTHRNLRADFLDVQRLFFKTRGELRNSCLEILP